MVWHDEVVSQYVMLCFVIMPTMQPLKRGETTEAAPVAKVGVISGPARSAAMSPHEHDVHDAQWAYPAD
jgi:hypothetical protein